MDKHRMFYGLCFGKPKQRIVAVGNGQSEPRELLPKRSRKVKDYSHAFNWGTMNNASHQLALALLLQVSNNAAVALKYHQKFVREVIAQINNSNTDWDISENSIKEWIAQQQNQECGYE